MPTFKIYCKTPDLATRTSMELVDTLPSFFSISDIVVGTPHVTIGDASDPLWAGFPYPTERGVVYIFDDIIPAQALGGGGDMRASVRVCEGDTNEVLSLRLWHELLHAVGQPADDMVILAADWQTPIERILWHIWRAFGMSVDVPFWQSRYYAWLTNRAEQDPLL